MTTEQLNEVAFWFARPNKGRIGEWVIVPHNSDYRRCGEDFPTVFYKKSEAIQRAKEMTAALQTMCPECARSFGPHYRGKCDH